MTIEEIQTALAELVAAMVEKAISIPQANLEIKGGGRFVLYLWCSSEEKQLDGDFIKSFYGAESVGEAVEAARAYIAALPSPEEAVTREYLGKVADAIDFGTKHSIADEYVTPLRGVTCAMTDNLLTKEPTQ